MELFVRSPYEVGLKLNLLLQSKNKLAFKTKMFQGLRAARRPDENDVVAYRLIRFSRGNFFFLIFE